MKESPITYCNLEQKFPPNAETVLRTDNVYIQHTAWNHWGKMYYENGLFKEEVWINNNPVEVIEGKTLEEVFTKVNDKYGWG